jgi:hypothetical protein
MATQLFTDSFTRADTAVDARPFNTVAVGNEWADVVGSGYRIVSNALVCASGSAVPLLRPAYETTQNSKFRAVINMTGVVSTNVKFVSRYHPLRKTGYLLVYVNGDLTIYKTASGGGASLYPATAKHFYPPSQVDYNFELWIKYVSATRTIVCATMAQASTPTVYEAVAILADDDYSPAQWATTPNQPLCNGIITDSGGSTVKSVVVYDLGSDALPTGAPLSCSAARYSSSTATTVLMAVGTPNGGTSPYTYQWYRSATSNFTPGAGNILSGKTSASLTDTPPDTARYFYKCKVTDNVSATSTTNEVMASTTTSAVVLGIIGDSTFSVVPADGAQSAGDLLGGAYGRLINQPPATVSNQSSAGTQTSDWQSGGSPMTNALAAFASASVTHVVVQLGTNDANSSVAATTFNTRLTNTVGAITGAGYKVVLNYPQQRSATNGNSYSTAANGFVAQYIPYIDAMVNGTTVFAGADVFDWSSQDTYGQFDAIHFGYPQTVQIADMTATAIYRAIAYSDPGAGNVKGGASPTTYKFSGATKTGTLNVDNATAGNIKSGVTIAGATGDGSIEAAAAAAQLVTDKAAVDAGKPDLNDTRTILTITGTQSVSGIQAAAAAAAASAQLATDVGAVEAKKQYVQIPQTILGVPGTFDATGFESAAAQFAADQAEVIANQDNIKENVSILGTTGEDRGTLTGGTVTVTRRRGAIYVRGGVRGKGTKGF